MCGIIYENMIVIDSNMRVIPRIYFPSTAKSHTLSKSLETVRDHVLSKLWIFHNKIRYKFKIVLALAVNNMEIKISLISRCLYLYS